MLMGPFVITGPVWIGSAVCGWRLAGRLSDEQRSSHCQGRKPNKQPCDVSRDEVRDEVMRDPKASHMFLDDDTPQDVQQYIFLEARRRAKMRKLGILGETDNDLFAPPNHPPDNFDPAEHDFFHD